MKDLKPREIVDYLNQFVVGQTDAKKSVAVALRNRWRSGRLTGEMAKEINPKNILLIGPTGVGKTEIARRIATLLGAPFVKVEATKYTEVGYVGRDVESMVRDLAEEAVRIVKKGEMGRYAADAEKAATEKIADALCPRKKSETRNPMEIIFGEKKTEASEEPISPAQREELLARIRRGELDDREVEIEVEEKRSVGSGGDNEQMNQLSQMFTQMMPKKMKKKKISVRLAKKILTDEAADNMVDMESVSDKAIRLAEEQGIIFIDEFDKIAVSSGTSRGQDVSREGVQRDILPIVEGATVKTKYGPMKTDHVLFMAAGAFHLAKPSDLIPELQGRFPIRVTLQSLTKEDLRQILTEPKQSLIRQYTALLETEGAAVSFAEDALEAMAEIAASVNGETEDIGARRLYTILEKVLEDISFEIPDAEEKEVHIDEVYVRSKLEGPSGDLDASRYIL